MITNYMHGHLRGTRNKNLNQKTIEFIEKQLSKYKFFPHGAKHSPLEPKNQKTKSYQVTVPFSLYTYRYIGKSQRISKQSRPICIQYKCFLVSYLQVNWSTGSLGTPSLQADSWQPSPVSHEKMTLTRLCSWPPERDQESKLQSKFNKIVPLKFCKIQLVSARFWKFCKVQMVLQCRNNPKYNYYLFCTS